MPLTKRAPRAAKREEKNFTFTAWGKLHKCEGSERLQRRVMVQQEEEIVTPSSRAYHKKKKKKKKMSSASQCRPDCTRGGERTVNSCDALHTVSHDKNAVSDSRLPYRQNTAA